MLAAKVERQQRQLHEGFVERDRTIRELNELLSTRASERSERPSDHEWCERRDFRPVFLKKISRSDVLIERAGLKL
ncbi:MAG TPA: hypothetical protein VK653_11780 [Xanthobacteraceae bacterium]|nr:hypothetical protein [Xanthobacteraceae bacterium]